MKGPKNSLLTSLFSVYNVYKNVMREILDNINKISNEIDDLNTRIEEARKQEPIKKKSIEHKKANIGWRMVTELVVGMFIGFILGYTIDNFFNILPVFTIILSMLGFFAGIKTMIKTSKEFDKLS